MISYLTSLGSKQVRCYLGRITETVFSCWRGYHSGKRYSSRDYPSCKVSPVVIATIFVLINLLVGFRLLSGSHECGLTERGNHERRNCNLI